MTDHLTRHVQGKPTLLQWGRAKPVARELLSAIRNGATRNLYAAATLPPRHPCIGGCSPRWCAQAAALCLQVSPVPSGQPCAFRYVANVAEGLREAQVTAIFAPYGDLESIRLVPKKRAAFINFGSIGSAAGSK